MPIQLQCPGCKATLNVPEEMAGKAGKCIHCGHRVKVPLPPGKVADVGLPTLFDSTPEAMVRELSRRQISALLLTFRPTDEGSYDLADIAENEIRCIVTDDVHADRFAELVASISKRFGPRKKTPGTLAEPTPYELKGDRLGMSLDDFKQKYARHVEGTHARLPLCSDTAWGKNKATLHAEPWHAKAGIIHARVDLPDENDSPTVAGVKSELLLYQFVDGQLFRIAAFLPTDQFHVVSEAAVKKFGPVVRETQKPRELVWENTVSSVVLTRGSVHPREPSLLVLTHHRLAEVAASRAPHAAEDI